MRRLKNYIATNLSGDFLHLNLLHVINDGFAASLVLLLPFIALTQNLTLTQVGVLGAVLSGASIVLALPSAYLAQRYGGVKVLIAAAFLYAAAFLAISATGQFYVLIPLFVVAGIGFGVFHPIAFSLIAKWTPRSRRGRAMGDFTAIGDVGRIGIAALVSLLVVAAGWQYVAVGYAVAGLTIAAFYWRFYARRPQAAVPATTHHATVLTFWQVLKNKRYVLTICSAAFDGFATASLFLFLPFLLLERHVNPALLGVFTALFFVGALFGKVVLGRFVDRIGAVKVFIVAELLMAAFVWLLAGATALPLIIVCLIILGVVAKGTVPVLQSMVSESVEHHGNFEKAFGIESLVSSAAAALAPLVLGIVSDQFGVQSAFYAMATAAIFAALPAVWFYVLRPRSAGESAKN